jgi:hypothetical protein
MNGLIAYIYSTFLFIVGMVCLGDAIFHWGKSSTAPADTIASFIIGGVLIWFSASILYFSDSEKK